MAPPTCPQCGAARTELASAGLREVWHELKGLTWDCATPSQAYWHLCLSCHQARWPGDGRSRNRHSRPVAIDDRRIVGGRSRGVLVDFYLTEAPPEHIADVPIAPVRSRAAWRFAWPPPGRPWPFGTPMCVVYPAECSGAACPSRRLGRCDPSWAARLRSRSPLPRFSADWSLRSCLRASGARTPRGFTVRWGGVDSRPIAEVDRAIACLARVCDACWVPEPPAGLVGYRVALAGASAGCTHAALVCDRCSDRLRSGGAAALPGLDGRGVAVSTPRVLGWTGRRGAVTGQRSSNILINQCSFLVDGVGGRVGRVGELWCSAG
jgi:hypothetical protein